MQVAEGKRNGWFRWVNLFRSAAVSGALHTAALRGRVRYKRISPRKAG